MLFNIIKNFAIEFLSVFLARLFKFQILSDWEKLHDLQIGSIFKNLSLLFLPILKANPDPFFNGAYRHFITVKKKFHFIVIEDAVFSFF